MDEGSSKPRLHFVTCGTVDNGKSTLIGRLLYEQNLIPEDQLASLERDSVKYGTTGAEIDFSLLLDGLEAEREQNITIDVAYRYFSTPHRSFIVADAPGHEQYTRNMVSGASNADLALLLVDARQGLLVQTHRHAAVVSLLGIRHVILVVNKMDLVSFDQHTFAEIINAFQASIKDLNFTDVQVVPLSARFGDNVCVQSQHMPWYTGPTLLEYLEAVTVKDVDADNPFRFPVQLVSRPNADFRGFAGTIASGTITVGDAVVHAASGMTSRVARIVTADGDLPSSQSGDAVTLVLEGDIDLSRGDVLSAPDARPYVTSSFVSRLLWLDSKSLHSGSSYLLKSGTRSVAANVKPIPTNTEATTSVAGDGLFELSTAVPISVDLFRSNRSTGSFILIDRSNFDTVAVGLVERPLQASANVFRHDQLVTPSSRAGMKRQKPLVVWFTGLSGAGKSTIANLLEARLHEQGIHTMLLDGDNLRHGISRDLGFGQDARAENVRRVAEIAKLMTDAGLVVLCSLISPFRAERQLARDIIGNESFIEVFVDTPLEVCIARDPKGLYKRALAGEISNFTGVGQPYEDPEAPDVVLGRAGRAASGEAADLVDTLHRHWARN
jgi:bifunctional enzyme CysN/CysC